MMSRNMRSLSESNNEPSVSEQPDNLWNVVTFLESNSCSVVPQSWLVKTGSIIKCKWPKHKVTNNMIVKRQIPSEDWLQYNVKIVGLPYDSYEDALARENLLINESSSETEPIHSCIKKAKKSQRVKMFKTSVVFNDNTETMSDNTSPEYTPIKVPKISNIKVTQNRSPVNLRLSPNIISEAFKALNSCSVTNDIHPNNYSDINNDNIIQNYQSNSNTARRQLFCNDHIQINNTENIYSETDQVQNNSEQCSMVDNSSRNLLKKIHETVVSINMYVQRLDARMDKLESYEKCPLQMKASCSFDDQFLNLFPLKSTEELNNIEQMMINDKEFEIKIKSYLEIIGGTDVKNLIKRNLERLFSNELAKKCSWTGSGRDSVTRESNHKLQNLKLMAFMLELCRSKFNSTDCEFEKNIKDWFRHGFQRYKRDLEKNTDPSLN